VDKAYDVAKPQRLVDHLQEKKRRKKKEKRRKKEEEEEKSHASDSYRHRKLYTTGELPKYKGIGFTNLLGGWLGLGLGLRLGLELGLQTGFLTVLTNKALFL
jgi:hypothetical protein